MPYKGGTSLFRTDGLPQEGIWNLGRGIAEPQQLTLHGRGDLVVAAIVAPLSIREDDEPSRHVELLDWPDDKHRQKIIAMHLANAAALVLCEQGGTAR